MNLALDPRRSQLLRAHQRFGRRGHRDDRPRADGRVGEEHRRVAVRVGEPARRHRTDHGAQVTGHLERRDHPAALAATDDVAHHRARRDRVRRATHAE